MIPEDNNFIIRLAKLHNSENKSDAIRLIYDYFGAIFISNNITRSNIIMEEVRKRNFSSWLLIPFLTITKNYKTAVRHSLYNQFLKKYKNDALNSETFENVKNRLL